MTTLTHRSPSLTVPHRPSPSPACLALSNPSRYTGAPYFAAYAALKMGADLAHVFCTERAGPVIKAYSPELIVHPYLSEKSAVSTVMKKFEPWLNKFKVPGTCVIVGPGLGRDPKVLAQAREILLQFNARGVPVVLDADGLHMLGHFEDLWDELDLNSVVLTPNGAEWRRLMDGTFYRDGVIRDGGATIVRKGITIPDIYSRDDTRPYDFSQRRFFEGGTLEARYALKCAEPGSNRRAGGQGDVLTGCIATFIAWNYPTLWSDSSWKVEMEETSRRPAGRDIPKEVVDASDEDVLLVLAADAGCTVTRMANRRAFEKHHRAMGAPDLISELGGIIYDLETVRDARLGPMRRRDWQDHERSRY